MPRPVPSIPAPWPSPEPWAQDARRAAAALHRVPAFVPHVPAVSPAPVPLRPPVPDAPPRGPRRAARAVALWVLAPLALWLALNAALSP